MRGAAPDVECPRCSALFPPTFETLVTCATCGLVFTPHEVVHRAPLVETLTVPSSLVVRTEGDTVIVTSHLSRLSGFATVGLMGLLVFIVAGHWGALDLMQKVFMFALVPAASYLGLAKIASKRTVTIAPTSFSIRTTPLPLPGMSAITLDRKETTAIGVEDEGKRFVVTARARGMLHR